MELCYKNSGQCYLAKVRRRKWDTNYHSCRSSLSPLLTSTDQCDTSNITFFFCFRREIVKLGHSDVMNCKALNVLRSQNGKFWTADVLLELHDKICPDRIISQLSANSGCRLRLHSGIWIWEVLNFLHFSCVHERIHDLYRNIAVMPG